MEYGERILFGERLRGKRNALGFTQEYVSEQIGITLRFYQMIERGEPDLIPQRRLSSLWQSALCSRKPYCGDAAKAFARTAGRRCKNFNAVCQGL